jgi:SAM-dependent methyltransferase
MSVHLNKHMEQINYNHIAIEEKPFADRLAQFIKHIIRPHNVLDIGCGPGHFVQSMNDIGVHCIGIDIDERIQNVPNLYRDNILDTKLVAHTCICLEVFEHIDSEYNDELVDKVSHMFTDTLIFTAAQPGQGGVGHINCQKPGYWDHKFTQTGLVRNTLMEEMLRLYCKQGRYMGWFYNNLLVYTKY